MGDDDISAAAAGLALVQQINSLVDARVRDLLVIAEDVERQIQGKVDVATVDAFSARLEACERMCEGKVSMFQMEQAFQRHSNTQAARGTALEDSLSGKLGKAEAAAQNKAVAKELKTLNSKFEVLEKSLQAKGEVVDLEAALETKVDVSMLDDLISRLDSDLADRVVQSDLDKALKLRATSEQVSQLVARASKLEESLVEVKACKVDNIQMEQAMQRSANSNAIRLAALEEMGGDKKLKAKVAAIEKTLESKLDAAMVATQVSEAVQKGLNTNAKSMALLQESVQTCVRHKDLELALGRSREQLESVRKLVDEQADAVRAKAAGMSQTATKDMNDLNTRVAAIEKSALTIQENKEELSKALKGKCSVLEIESSVQKHANHNAKRMAAFEEALLGKVDKDDFEKSLKEVSVSAAPSEPTDVSQLQKTLNTKADMTRVQQLVRASDDRITVIEKKIASKCDFFVGSKRQREELTSAKGTGWLFSNLPEAEAKGRLMALLSVEVYSTKGSSGAEQPAAASSWYGGSSSEPALAQTVSYASVRYEFKGPENSTVVQASYMVPCGSSACIGAAAVGQYWVPLNDAGQFSYRKVDDQQASAKTNWVVLAYIG